MEEKDDLIKRLVEGDPDVKTQGDADLEAIDEILQKTSQWAVPQNKGHQEIWEKLEEKVENQGQSVIRKRILNLRIGIAASVMIIGYLAYYITLPGLSYIETAATETKEVALPDGSLVNLNSSSTLSYNPETFKEDRKVNLDGEAYFEVKSGSTFSVHAKGVITTVLGTSFNIYAREAKVNVACLTGKVEVTGENKIIVIGPGQKIVSEKKVLSLQKKAFEPVKAISWMKGKFYYDNEAFDLDVSEIERQFGVTVEGPSFQDRFYSGYFDKESLDVALRQVFVPMGYSYEIKESTIYIK